MKKNSSNKQIPTINGSGFGGCLAKLQEDHLKLFCEGYEKYGDILRFRFGPVYSYLISKPEYIEHIFKTNAENYTRKSRIYKFMNPIVKNSMLVSEGEVHKKQRETGASHMKPSEIKKQYPSIVDEVNRFCDRMQEAADNNKTINIHEEMDKVSLGTFDSIFLKVEAVRYIPKILEYKNYIVPYIYKRMKKVFNVPSFIPTEANRRFRSSVKSIRNIAKDIIEERRNDINDTDALIPRLNLYGLDITEIENEERIISELICLLMLVFETSGIALAWTWYLLAKHPEILQKLIEEINTVLGGRTPEYNDLSKLGYMDQVLKESLRLYPPAWQLTRRALKRDFIDGYEIPKNSTINVCLYSMHRNKNYWENPDKFDPDRFAQGKTIKPYVYFPFGLGKHSCLGGAFFYIEAKVIIAMVLQRFRLQLVSNKDAELDPTISLTPRNPILMKVESIC